MVCKCIQIALQTHSKTAKSNANREPPCVGQKYYDANPCKKLNINWTKPVSYKENNIPLHD